MKCARLAGSRRYTCKHGHACFLTLQNGATVRWSLFIRSLRWRAGSACISGHLRRASAGQSHARGWDAVMPQWNCLVFTSLVSLCWYIVLFPQAFSYLRSEETFDQWPALASSLGQSKLYWNCTVIQTLGCLACVMLLGWRFQTFQSCFGHVSSIIVCNG